MILMCRTLSVCTLFVYILSIYIVTVSVAMVVMPSSVAAQDMPVLAADETIEQQFPDPKAGERARFVTLAYENDLIGAGTDSDYTNGARISYFDTGASAMTITSAIADAIPTFDLNDTTSVMYSLGQNLYTPKEIGQRVQDPDDRPWAAFLYGSVGLATISDNHLDEVELTLGVVGPWALGEQVQKAVHRHVTDSPMPKGWSNQLKNEPGVVVSWARRWPYAASHEIDGFLLSATPSIGASLGNIYTHANAGMTVSLRPSKSAWEDMPLRVRPAIPGTGYFTTPDDGWGWSLFAGFDGRIVGHNIFLDGNTFRNSHSVDKNHVVLDSSAGIAFTFRDIRLSYTITHRTKEFKGQRKAPVFGALSLTHRF